MLLPLHLLNLLAPTGGATVTLSGTITSVTESDVVEGGATVVLTLSGDTFVADGATFDDIRQDIIDGISGGGAESSGWNNEVRDKESIESVTRTSDTVVTVTLLAHSGFNISVDEVVTVTLPASASVASGAIVATPTATIPAIISEPIYIRGQFQSAATAKIKGGFQATAKIKGGFQADASVRGKFE